MMDRNARRALLALLIATGLCMACVAAGAVLDAVRPDEIPTATATVPTPEEATPLPSDTPLPTGTPTGTMVPTATPPPTPSPSPTPALPDSPEAACVPAGNPRQVGRVTRVIDGDTIEVEIGGQRFPLRYIGIDTPELNVPEDPAGAQARLENETLVLGRTLLLVRDVSETDRFDRLLRYVFVGEEFVNYQLVRMGIAEAIRYHPDDACHETFLAAQAAAQQEGLGRWGLMTPVAPPGDAACDPAYPDVCIPPPPPDLDCVDVPYRRFQVLPPDPHNFDGDKNGIGCER